MLDPKGRAAMVSGASRGIGRAIAERLRSRGFRVSAGVRNVTDVPWERMTQPEDLAVLAETPILLPHTAANGERPVNWRLEPLL